MARIHFSQFLDNEAGLQLRNADAASVGQLAEHIATCALDSELFSVKRHRLRGNLKDSERKRLESLSAEAHRYR
eukprot:8974513-Karenia_brevis.AAC.1